MYEIIIVVAVVVHIISSSNSSIAVKIVITLNAVIAAICSQVKGRGTSGAVCDPSCEEHNDRETDHVGNNMQFGK